MNKLKSIKSFSSLIKKETLNENKKISILTLSNPSKRNSLGYELLHELKSSIEYFHNININSKGKESSIVIISAEGNVFSSGHDLKELSNSDQSKQSVIFNLLKDICLSIQNNNTIYISEVYGLAAAGGCQLSASCDLTIASNLSGFSCPGIKLGLFCSTPAVELSRLISKRHAMHMLLTGEVINAKTAYDWGLVNKIINVNEGKDVIEQSRILRKGTIEYAEVISNYSSQSYSLGKEIFRRQLEEKKDKAYEIGINGMMENLKVDDCKEGLQSFVEKRKPKFNF